MGFMTILKLVLSESYDIACLSVISPVCESSITIWWKERSHPFDCSAYSPTDGMVSHAEVFNPRTRKRLLRQACLHT